MINFLWPLMLAGVFGLTCFVSGYHVRDLSAQVEIAQRIAEFDQKIAAANKATEADKKRLAADLKLSEAKIDEWTKKYGDVLSKGTNAACLLSDDDVYFLRYDSRNPRPKPRAQ